MEGPGPQAAGSWGWGGVHNCLARLCRLPRTLWGPHPMKSQRPLSPEATCRAACCAPGSAGRAGGPSPGDHVASSCSRTEQSKTLLPLCRRKVASPICRAVVRRGQRGGQTEVLVSRLWGGRKWGGLPGPKRAPRGPAPAKRWLQLYLPRAENKSWLLPETREGTRQPGGSGK